MKISNPKKLKLLSVLKDYAVMFDENRRLSITQVREVTRRVYRKRASQKTQIKESKAIRTYMSNNYSKIQKLLKEQKAQPIEHRHFDLAESPGPSQDTAHQEFTSGVVTSIADPMPEETVDRLAQGQPEHVIDAGEDSSEDNTLRELYKKILNHLPRQTFDTFIDQLRTLRFDSEEKLQSVVDLVYEQAITKPSLIPKYATMCKQLASMQVIHPNKEKDKEEDPINFRKLIMMRCEREFANNFMDMKACTDPTKKKKKIQLAFIGFIAELFEQGMLTINMMHRCISQFLAWKDEGSLECLCKLLRATGRNLESKGQNLDPYMKQMLNIVSGKVPTAVSPRVRFMLQDVIELKMSRWIPGEDNGQHLDPQLDGSLMSDSSNVSTDALRTVTLYEPMKHDPGSQQETQM